MPPPPGRLLGVWHGLLRCTYWHDAVGRCCQTPSGLWAERRAHVLKTLQLFGFSKRIACGGVGPCQPCDHGMPGIATRPAARESRGALAGLVGATDAAGRIMLCFFFFFWVRVAIQPKATNGVVLWSPLAGPPPKQARACDRDPHAFLPFVFSSIVFHFLFPTLAKTHKPFASPAPAPPPPFRLQSG